VLKVAELPNGETHQSGRLFWPQHPVLFRFHSITLGARLPQCSKVGQQIPPPFWWCQEVNQEILGRTIKYPEFSKKVKAARAASGLSQQGFAEEIGVALSTFIKWEQGRSTPQGISFEKLSNSGWWGEHPGSEYKEGRGDSTKEEEEPYLSYAHTGEGKRLLKAWLRLPDTVRPGKIYELEALAVLFERAEEARASPTNLSRVAAGEK
jgi:transcriptional regulator with XRE-family HTH domain